MESDFEVTFEVTLRGHGIEEHAHKMAARARRELELAFKEQVEIDSVKVHMEEPEVAKLRSDAEGVRSVWDEVVGEADWDEDKSVPVRRFDVGLLMESPIGNAVLPASGSFSLPVVAQLMVPSHLECILGEGLDEGNHMIVYHQP